MKWSCMGTELSELSVQQGNTLETIKIISETVSGTIDSYLNQV